MVNDPVADFITRLQNAGMAGRTEVRLPYSILKHRIAELLEEKGYIASLEKTGKDTKKELVVTLAEVDGKPRIHEVERISKPSRRLYTKANDIGKVKGGRGMYVLTTSKGILSDEDARKEGVGGELLFKIW
ncbi:MAG: 30S ribosomal protein S8 [Candidatus Paceibacterota bacterium]